MSEFPALLTTFYCIVLKYKLKICLLFLFLNFQPYHFSFFSSVCHYVFFCSRFVQINCFPKRFQMTKKTRYRKPYDTVSLNIIIQISKTVRHCPFKYYNIYISKIVRHCLFKYAESEWHLGVPHFIVPARDANRSRHWTIVLFFFMIICGYSYNQTDCISAV